MSKQLSNGHKSQLAAFHRLNVDLIKRREVVPMVSEILAMAKDIKPRLGECYTNAAELILAADSFGCDEIYYILGVAGMHGGLTSGHAWVEVRGNHYDLTFELNDLPVKGRFYAEVVRFTPSQLDDFLEQRSMCPPVFPVDVPNQYFDSNINQEMIRLASMGLIERVA